jgi:hypothetical protein
MKIKLDWKFIADFNNYSELEEYKEEKNIKWFVKQNDIFIIIQHFKILSN